MANLKKQLEFARNSNSKSEETQKEIDALKAKIEKKKVKKAELKTAVSEKQNENAQALA